MTIKNHGTMKQPETIESDKDIIDRLINKIIIITGETITKKNIIKALNNDFVINSIVDCITDTYNEDDNITDLFNDSD